MQQPWEAGWQPVEGPAPQSDKVQTKVVMDAVYHLWKNQNGIETIQKDASFYRVSPGAFNTIPSEANLGIGGGVPKHQT